MCFIFLMSGIQLFIIKTKNQKVNNTNVILSTRYKGGLISKGIFLNVPNHYPQVFPLQLNLVSKVEDSDLAHLFENETKVKIPFEIKLYLQE